VIRPALRDIEVYLCVEPVDFRKQVNGLSMLVESELHLDPLSSAIFAFTNRRRDRVKLLVWETNGFVLWMKRLERERFCWPRSCEGVVALSGQELNWLLDGLDLRFWRPHAALRYEVA
jgi:transposase